MTIQYYRKNVYGNELNYMVDNEVALTIKRITGRSTLTNSDMHQFAKLGIQFEEVLAPRG